MMLRRTLLTLAIFGLIFGLAGCDNNDGGGRATATSGNGASSKNSGQRSLEEIKKSGQLRIAIKNDAPPFCFKDEGDVPKGFDVDLGFRLARHLGVTPIFVEVTSAERISKLQAGEVDCVIATLTANRTRAKKIDFSIPYYEDHQRVIVLKDSEIKSYRDLGSKKVAVLKDSTSARNLQIVAPEAKIKETKTNKEAFELLNSGKVDAVTGDGIQLLGMKVRAADPSKYEVAGEGFSVEPYVIGLPRNDSDLRNAVDDFLTDLWNNGTWIRLYHKWLGADSAYKLDPHFKMSVLPE